MADRPTRLRGVGTHLLLAFCGIAAFSALVAGAALYSFLQVGHSLTVIEGRIGPTLASLGVSRTVERIVSASSVLVAATSEEERTRRFADLLDETARLRSFLNE